LRLRVLSDLHFEFHRDEGAEFIRSQEWQGVDLLVLAGDITKMRIGFYNTLKRFRDQFNCPIVFVPGNHEYHESDLATVRRGLNDAVHRLRGVDVLDNNVLTVKATDQTRRVVGTTLWYGKTPAPKHPLILSTDEQWGRGIIREVNEKGVVERPYADFEAIKKLHEWYDDEHKRAKKFLEENVREGDIVVTHFLPTRHSTPDKFRGALNNNWFVAAELESFIEERKPALWIHGHTHTSCDYWIGETRIVCNPLGYLTEGEFNAAFQDSFNVEVPPIVPV
jgi:Icc-related predicted phosphoesterase